MPSSTWMVGRAGRVAAVALIVAGALGAGARRAAAQKMEVVARARVPTRIGQRSAAAVAATVLSAQGWPVTMADSARGVMASQWLYFKAGSLSRSCWIRARLIARPVSADSTELAAGVWLAERVGTAAAQDFVRSLFDAFHEDVAAGIQPGHGVRGSLQAKLRYDDGDFTVCGAYATPR